MLSNVRTATLNTARDAPQSNNLESAGRRERWILMGAAVLTATRFVRGVDAIGAERELGTEAARAGEQLRAARELRQRAKADERTRLARAVEPV